jgi:O-antigen/teichoic acid export membrane protein
MNREESIPSQPPTPGVVHPLKRARGWFKDRLFRQLFKNVGVLVSGDAVSSLFGLGYLALTTRALGARQFGVLVLVQTYAALVDRLVNFQSWQGLIKYGAEALEQKRYDDFKGMIKLGTALDAAGAVLGAAVGISVVYSCGHWFGWDQETRQMAMVYSGVILCSLSGTPVGIVRLFDQFKVFAAQRLLVESFKLIAVLIACLSGAGLWVFVLIWMAGDAIKHLFLLFMAHRLLCRGQMRDLTSTMDIPVKQLDVFIVSSVVSFEAVGIYKIIKQVSQVLSKVADPIYQAIYPQFAVLIANAQEMRAAKMVVKLGLLLLLVSVPLVILMSVTSPWWLNKFFGQVFAAESLVLTAYLALQTCALACEGIHPLFIAMGYVQKNFLILALANGCFLVAAWLLGKQAGLVGIVCALGIQFSLVIAMKSGYIVHKLRKTH